MENLTVPGTIDSLGKIAEYVKLAAQVANLESKAAYKLRLAVDEIATNIITHGYEEAGLTGLLAISVDIDDSCLILAIEDTAILFDPRQKAALLKEDLSQILEERAIGGLGIHLVLDSVDEFRYQRLANGNRNILVMHR
jgi:anti-sigma regulatory factor (Ser/Thr protein kinase)